MTDELKRKIIDFNNRFPVDRWWRKKYNIPYNSAAHRETLFIDQLWDFLEDQIFEEALRCEKYVPNIGEFMRRKEYESEEEKINDFAKEAMAELEEIRKLQQGEDAE